MFALGCARIRRKCAVSGGPESAADLDDSSIRPEGTPPIQRAATEVFHLDDVLELTSEAGGEPRAYKTVGTRPIRHDGVEKVTGQARYGADISLPGMLYGKVLRSPHAHARVLSIDTSRAEAHPDVRAVATAADLVSLDGLPADSAEARSLKLVRDNVLASDKVLYVGHAVAAVAASSPHVAEEALSLIDVDYDVLPHVTSVEAAMAPDAPALHDHLDPAAHGGPNVSVHEQHKWGDIEAGFAEADRVVEREFRTKTVHQGYVEPQNGTASWPPDGRLTIWCSSQGHFGIRDGAAKVLGLPVSEIKVVPMEIGGGFGGKLKVYLEPLAAVLSRKSGHPVQLTMSRSEVLEATGPTSGSLVRIRVGATNEGRITAAQCYFAFEAGAFPGAAPIQAAAAAILAPYEIDNILVDAYEVVDNKPMTSAYRAPGAPIVVYAAESVIDEMAEALGIDPIELRLLNVAEEGSRRADGVMNGRIGARETMEAVRSHPHYSAPLSGEFTGRGVGMGFCRNSTGPSTVVAHVLSNGTVSLVEGSVDIGGSRTAVAQQFAEVLGIPVSDVMPSIGDTDTIGYTSNTGGSGVAFKTGYAAYEAANDIARQLVERAALVWDVPADEIEYADGALRHKSDPELRMEFKEAAGILGETGGPVTGRANLHPTGSLGSYAANIVDVEVDPETGKVSILRLTAFQDAGTAIHPSYVEGQMQGGSAQGLGWALSEEYCMGDDGRLLNTSLLDYRMPTSLDLPMIDPVIVEVPNPGHPFGVKGVGEANIVSPLAAVANAIYGAIGVRLNELPMSPATIVKALSEESAGASSS